MDLIIKQFRKFKIRRERERLIWCLSSEKMGLYSKTILVIDLGHLDGVRRDVEKINLKKLPDPKAIKGRLINKRFRNTDRPMDYADQEE